MGLFDKKYCDICGEKIGLLGNRKLEDGNCCKNCANKLSPWFDERRHSTVERIKEQLAYREDNKQAVAAFHATRTFGESTMLRIDENARKFMVARTGNYANENPDVMDLSQVIDCRLDVKESRNELKQQDEQGNEKSYNPPRYEYDYDFYIVISVNTPWFDSIRFKLNKDDLILQDMTINRGGILRQTFDPHKSMDYQRYEAMGQEIVDILTGANTGSANTAGNTNTTGSTGAANTGAAPTPTVTQTGPWTCPVCGGINNQTGTVCAFCDTAR